MSSPTQRTLTWCKMAGWPAGVVEKWIPQTKQRKDLYGFIDIVVLDGKPGALGIQATSASNVSGRVTKIQEECTQAAIRWLQAGNRIWVIGWSKRGARGKRKLWTPRIVEVLAMVAVEGSEAVFWTEERGNGEEATRDQGRREAKHPRAG